VQGLTEFLPVSSSGHLVLFQALTGVENNDLVFEVLLHFATLLALILIFWRDLFNIAQSIFDVKIFNKNELSAKFRKDNNFRFAAGIIIGSIPAGLAGFFFEDQISQVFGKPVLTSVFLVITGIILYLTKFMREQDKRLGIWESLIVGFCQALAIVPGISRSGLTISGGLALGINKERAVKFSFFLSVPVILGGTVKEILDFFPYTADTGVILNLTAGFITAFISGYIAIKLLIRLTMSGKLYKFSFYCILLGIISFLYFTF